MSVEVTTNVNWATLDTSGLVDDNGVVNVTAARNTGRLEKRGNVEVSWNDKRKDVALMQESQGPFIAFDATGYDVSGSGGNVVLTGRSNEPRLAFSFNPQSMPSSLPDYFSIVTADGVVHGGMAVTGQVFEGDPGADSQYTFRIQLGFGPNDTGYERVMEVRCIGEGSSQGVVVRQPKGTGPVPPTPTDKYIRFPYSPMHVSWDQEETDVPLESNDSWSLLPNINQ